MANKITPPMSPLTSDVSQEMQEQIDELRQEAQKIRQDFLLIFGLLAAVIAFLTTEVQAFQYLKSFSMLVGFSAFLIAGLLTFVVALKTIARDDNKWKNYAPAWTVIALFLLIACICFYWSSHHYVFFVH